MLLEKSSKNATDPPKFRPICLLDTVGKVYENIINNRLLAEIEDKAPLNIHQYGFRKGCSTIDAAMKVISLAQRNDVVPSSRWSALILVDIKSAFNTANWEL